MKHCSICKCRCDIPKLLTLRGLTGIGVEIGVRRGDFSELMVRGWLGFMHLVDPWSDVEEYVEVEPHSYKWDNVLDHEATKERLLPYEGKYQIHKATSLEASKVLPDGLDFVYLDGNHAYNHVWLDLRLWWPKLRPGGIISGHDFIYYPLPGVTKAVVEFALLKQTTIFMIPGSAADRNNCCVDGQVVSWYMIKE